MEFEGIVFRKLPEMSGTSTRGAWKKQDVVFELPNEFNRKICVTFFGAKADEATALNEGDSVTVSVNVESREYNGRWYTDVRAWKTVRGWVNPNSAGSDWGAGSGNTEHGSNYGTKSTVYGTEVSPGIPNFDRAVPFSNSPNSNNPFGNDGPDLASSGDEVDDLPF
jgi:hypothetical protein